MNPSTIDTIEDDGDQLAKKSFYDESLVQYQEIKRLGVYLNGDCGSDGAIKPDWFDQQLFDQGKSVGQKYFFSCFFGHLCGVYILVRVPTIYGPLLTTGNSRCVSNLFGRYLSTLNHVKCWYEGDVWNPNDPAHKSLVTVRKAHKLVSNRLNVNKREHVDRLALSQFDMFLTLWAFVGSTFLRPKETGFPDDPKKVKAWLHFWRSIGYLLGVQDKYNICNDEDIERTRSIFKVVWGHDFKPLLVNSTINNGNLAVDKGQIMGESIIESMRSLIPTLSTAAFIKYLHDLHSIQSPVTLDRTGDKLVHTMIKWTMSTLLPSPVFESILNFLLSRRIARCNQNKVKIAEKLKGNGPINESDEKTDQLSVILNQAILS